MIQSIERLCGLLYEKDRAINTYSDVNEQAESIMHDLQVILELARKQDTAMLQMQDTLSSKKSSRTDQKELDYGMRRFLRWFGQTELRLNQGGKCIQLFCRSQNIQLTTFSPKLQVST
jgi:hypothetical protein